MSTVAARICIATIVFTAVIGDALAMHFGWCSISELIRRLDLASGSLVRWGLLALWIHFFIITPWGGWTH